MDRLPNWDNPFKANPIYATAALSTPAGVGLFVGSVVSPIVATLICEGVVPNGFSKLDY